VVIATLGDSITAGTPGWDPDPQVRAVRSSENSESQWQYWARLSHPELEFRNHGIDGQRTDEIAERLPSVVAGVTAIVLQGGINDIVQGRPIGEAADSFEGMLEGALGLGLRVAVAELLPWNNGWPDAEPKVRELNALLNSMASRANVIVLPFHDTLEDPELPGRMRADLTSDQNHPSVAGYRLLGELAFAPTGAAAWWLGE
jgi:lysophospholipase L1-like esterase